MAVGRFIWKAAAAVYAAVSAVGDVLGFPEAVVRVIGFLDHPIVTEWGGLIAAVIFGLLIATLDARGFRHKGGTMPMSRALYVVSRVRPRDNPNAYTDAEVDALSAAAREIRQAALNGEIQTWGKKWTAHRIDDVHLPIPQNYWVAAKINIGLLHPELEFDRHVLGSPEIEYTDLRVNGHQVLKRWPLNLWRYVRTRNMAPA